MKVKNIVFSGFMAAIMLSVTGAANAAVEIASRKYVDDTAVPAAVTQAVSQVEEKNYLTETAAGNTYLTKTDAAATYVTEQGATTVVENTLKNTETITQILTDTENGLGKELAAKADQSTVDGLASSVGALETAVGDETSGLVKDVADAAAAAAAAQDDLTELTGRVSTNETNIGALQTKVGTAELSTTAKNIAEAINELKTKTDGMATEGNFNEMNNKITGLETSVDALETAVGDETSGLTKDVADNKSAITTLNGDETVEGSVANTVKGMTVPKPTIDCGAGKMCVLSIGTDGNPVWVDVTQPYGE